jgi:hypothetical protein
MAPRWVVSCPECRKEFTHADIKLMDGSGSRDPFASPPKPKIPESGTELGCQHCGKTSIYRVFDLRYRAD